MASCGISSDVGLFSLGRNIFVGTTVGFGIGIGVGAGLLVVRKIAQCRAANEKMVVCMQELTQEMKELRSVIVRLEGNIVPVKETKLTRNQHSANSLKDFMSVRTNSDDEEEYFEMPGDEEITFTEAEPLQTSSPDEDIKSIIQEVELLSSDENNEKNTEKVHQLLENAIKQHPDSAELLWRFGKSFYDLASEKGKAGYLEEKKNILYKGLGIVQKAVKMDSQNASAQKWCALLLGSTSDYENTQEKILLGFKYKKHISKAIELNNRDSSSYHLLGRWCYEVSQLPWWQRKAASAFIAEPPTSTVQEALENFLKSEDLDPGFWLTNSYWIGKCYYEQSQYSKCKEWLQKVVVMNPKSEEDEKCLLAAEELLRSV